MTHVLDTDHVSILERRGGMDYAVLVANLSRYAEADVGVSVVSYHEQSLGCHTKINRARSPSDVIIGYGLLFRVIADFRRFNLVPFDAVAAQTFDGLKSLKLGVKTMDLRIAACALANNLTLVTRNVSDFGRIPGLRTEDWTR
jgi:tRNA(fMet)-specific endonuclease VapC